MVIPRVIIMNAVNNQPQMSYVEDKIENEE